jgi:hypothetical protein
MQKGILLSLMLLLFLMTGTGNVLRGQIVTDSNWVDEVKTVTLYKNGVELEQPVMVLGGDDRLLLRFDILGAETENYRYRIQHCDSRWQVDDMEPYEFINGFEEGPIENYASSFTTLQPYVNYYQYIPAQYSQLLISGNYVVSVFPQDYPDSILLTRRFCVTEGSVKADATVGVPYDNAAIFERREVDVTVENNNDYTGSMIPPMLNPAFFRVVVQQNGRIDNLRQLQFGGYDRGALSFKNHAENVFYCGNTFRYFDISNIRTAMYNVWQIDEYGGEWYAMLKPLEDRSNKVFITEVTLNGGMKVNVWDRTNKQTEADYVYVNFSLPMDYPFLNGNIYVVGDLTQWKMDEHSRMEYNMELKAYTLRLLLKQGYYAYQLLFLPVGETQGQTAVLEGDHYEMKNTYTAYVYYRAPNDRYDRLVGYVRK